MFFRCKSSPKNSNRIFLKDMVVDMGIGVFDAEKDIRQRVRINLTAELSIWPDARHDNIDDTVSYDSFVQHILKITQEDGHVHLVETLAEKIAQACLGEKHVEIVTVRVEKLDIYPFAIPGAEIVRVRSR